MTAPKRSRRKRRPRLTKATFLRLDREDDRLWWPQATDGWYTEPQ